MFEKIVCSLFVAILMLSMVYGADKLPRSYKSPLYSCSLSNRYYGDGVSFIKFKGHNFGSFAGTYVTLKQKDGKAMDCREKLLENATDIKFSEDGKVISFTTIHPVKKKGAKDKAGKVYAEVERQFKLNANTIEVNTKLTAKENITLAKSWLVSDLLNLNVASLLGANVEAKTIGRSPETIMALVPKVYSKNNWSMKSAYSSVKFIMDNLEFKIDAGKDSLVTVCHYGGTNMEISAKPMLKPYALKYAKGSSISWSFSVNFTEVK